MKKLISALAVIAFLLPAFAFADSNYWHLSWNDGNDTPQTQDLFINSDYHYFVASNETSRAPELWKTDTSFIWNDSTHTVTLGNISRDNIDLLSPMLDTIFTNLATSSATNTTQNTNISTLFTSISIINALTDQINANLYGTSTTMSAQAASTTSGLITQAQSDKLDALQVGQAWSWSQPSRSITASTGATGFQPSSTRISTVNYNVTVSTTATIGGSSGGYIALEIAPTNSSTAGDWIEMGRCGNSQAITLALALQSVQTVSCQVSADIPAGYYAKLRSVTSSGTPSFTFNSSSEVLK